MDQLELKKKFNKIKNNKPLIKYTLEILNKLKKEVYPFISTNNLKIKNTVRKIISN